MAEIIRRLGHLSEEQAVLVVELAKTQSRLFGGTEDFLVGLPPGTPLISARLNRACAPHRGL